MGQPIAFRTPAKPPTNMEKLRTAPEAHAEAALIVGTLALREAATVFNDPRRLISRMTAHLAVADASGIAADNEIRRLCEIGCTWQPRRTCQRWSRKREGAQSAGVPAPLMAAPQ